jgi:Spy/CpxP family protein refolding chaperone
MHLMGLASICAALAICFMQPVKAQDRDMGHGGIPTTDSPYAGMESRTIKTLSDRDIADLQTGRGRGLALAAELNGYPGPAHVLDLADDLKLSDEQRARTRALFDAMKAETIPIGERIIAEETTLDRLFRERRVSEASLARSTKRIALAEGELRYAHLRYHLAMIEVLSPQQISRYRELRGYAAAHGSTHDHAD